jgi:hypothetical protein
MSSKFGALAANVSESYKVVLIDPFTDQPIIDKSGNPAFIEVLSADSDEGRAFDRERGVALTRKALRRGGQSIDDDALEQNVAKLARLTKAWHLVDPVLLEPINVECSVENAADLYSSGGTAHIFRQVWLGANEPANFMRRSSKIS